MGSSHEKFIIAIVASIIYCKGTIKLPHENQAERLFNIMCNICKLIDILLVSSSFVVTISLIQQLSEHAVQQSYELGFHIKKKGKIM